MITEYTERHKRLSNKELLIIIDESSKYNAIAVETAKLELESRALSAKELDQANSKIAEQKRNAALKTEHRAQREVKIKKKASTILDTINPIQTGIQTPEKIIRVTVLIFGFVAIYRLFNQYWVFEFLFSGNLSDWDFSMTELFFPLILLPISVFLLWKRIKIGWILICIFLCYSIVNVIGIMYINSSLPPLEFLDSDGFLQRVPSSYYIMTIIFYGGFLFIVCKNKVRDVFNISQQTMLLTIASTAVFTFTFLYTMLS